MTWFAPVLIAVEDRFGSRAPDAWSSWPVAASGLGSAIAGSWSWDDAVDDPVSARAGGVTPLSPRQPAGVRLNAPTGTLRRMAEAARALGRSESDVWVEAAREWLLRHHPEAPDEGHTPFGAQPRATHAIKRRMREWRAIDDLLDTLRDDPPHARREPIPA